MDAASVLSMTFEEAKKVSPKSLEIPPFYKVAADEITVLKSDAAGQPLRVRARGKSICRWIFANNCGRWGRRPTSKVVVSLL
ncbi:hypothetical protein [Verrucomicrobium spinosum]|uniref:hypothetical protein n=1 Tax=Verrucomicrobium spinosum TaxID=2736 RepID=UPI00094616D7|nr:hypothetical protein [Verrucomicrobium spinosum]